MKKLFITFIMAFLGLAFSFIPAGAAGISVTSVDISNDLATVVINNVVEIREIKIEGNTVEFPTYVSSSGRVYPQVKFRTPSVEREVTEAILNNRPSSERIERITYDITGISTFDREDSSLAGFATVVLNNEMEIDVRLMEARYGDDYWVSWPARAPDKDRGEDGWQDLVRVTNRRVKGIIEEDLIETFKASVDQEEEPQVSVRVEQGRVDEPLSVTRVEVDRSAASGDMTALAEVDLNYAFRIKDIEVYRRRGQVFLEFPRQITDSDRVYPLMRIFSRALRSEIRRALSDGTVSEDKYSVIGFEITRFERNRFESALKYRGAVTLNGALEINFSILDGDGYDAFVSWPSVRIDGEYEDKIFPVNRQVSETIEDAILKRYYGEQ